MGFWDGVKKFIQYNKEHSTSSNNRNSWDTNNNRFNNSRIEDSSLQRGIYVDAETGKPVSATSSNHLGASKYYGSYNGTGFSGKIGNNFISNGTTDIESFTKNNSNVRFVPENEMVAKGYGSYVPFLGNKNDSNRND